MRSLTHGERDKHTGSDIIKQEVTSWGIKLPPKTGSKASQPAEWSDCHQTWHRFIVAPWEEDKETGSGLTKPKVTIKQEVRPHSQGNGPFATKLGTDS